MLIVLCKNSTYELPHTTCDKKDRDSCESNCEQPEEHSGIVECGLRDSSKSTQKIQITNYDCSTVVDSANPVEDEKDDIKDEKFEKTIKKAPLKCSQIKKTRVNQIHYTNRTIKEGKNRSLIEALPVTTVEAKQIARRINAHCRTLKWKKVTDSLLLYANKGISLYENSSLFFLKAKALFLGKRYTEAVEACDIARVRGDYWTGGDKRATIRIKLDCMIAINKKFPSRINANKISELERQYECFY